MSKTEAFVKAYEDAPPETMVPLQEAVFIGDYYKEIIGGDMVDADFTKCNLDEITSLTDLLLEAADE